MRPLIVALLTTICYANEAPAKLTLYASPNEDAKTVDSVSMQEGFNVKTGDWLLVENLSNHKTAWAKKADIEKITGQTFLCETRFKIYTKEEREQFWDKQKQQMQATMQKQQELMNSLFESFEHF